MAYEKAREGLRDTNVPCHKVSAGRTHHWTHPPPPCLRHGKQCLEKSDSHADQRHE